MTKVSFSGNPGLESQGQTSKKLQSEWHKVVQGVRIAAKNDKTTSAFEQI